MMERVTDVDTAGKRVLCGGVSVPFDELIIATGSQPNYFGHADWASSAPGLKTLGDALSLRGQLLGALEHAAAVSPAERQSRF